jgi:hypothetical protein
MNETMSLVLATTILAIGGLGLYMYKTSDEPDYNEDELLDDNYDENEDDDLSKSDSEDDLSIDSVDAVDDEYDKPKPKSRGKTKRAKKSGGTKRKY